MRRSSLRLLFVSAALLAVALAGLLTSPESKAPPMTTALAQSLLDRGKEALESRDTSAILSLFSPDARILGRTSSEMRPLIEQAMRELGKGAPLTVKYSKLEVTSDDREAKISVSVDVRQHLPEADASYYRPRIHLVLRKERVPHLLGLTTREVWRIQHLASDESLDLPTR
jgi:hypothetical protein